MPTSLAIVKAVTVTNTGTCISMRRCVVATRLQRLLDRLTAPHGTAHLADRWGDIAWRPLSAPAKALPTTCSPRAGTGSRRGCDALPVLDYLSLSHEPACRAVLVYKFSVSLTYPQLELNSICAQINYRADFLSLQELPKTPSDATSPLQRTPRKQRWNAVSFRNTAITNWSAVAAIHRLLIVSTRLCAGRHLIMIIINNINSINGRVFSYASYITILNK